MKRMICMLSTALALTGGAQAQDATSSPASHIYLGAGVTVADHFEDNNKSGLKFFGGYAFNKNWAVEAGLSRFGGRKYDLNWPDNANQSYSTKGFGSYAAARYSLPIGERFAAYGKLGLAHSERTMTYSTGWYHKDIDNGVYAAVGGQAKLTDQLALTLEYEHYGKKKRMGAKEKLWSLGLQYAF